MLSQPMAGKTDEGIKVSHTPKEALDLGAGLLKDAISLDLEGALGKTNEAIEKLQEVIARELGYRLVDHRLELYGITLEK